MRALLIAVLAVLVASYFYACRAARIMEEEDAKADRDPLTGIIRGVEVITILPPEPWTDSPKGAILFIHGFLAGRDCFNGLGAMMAREGYVVRMMRLPGHGTSTADLAHQKKGANWQAVKTEYEALAAQYDKISVVGFSMGGTLTTILASRQEVERIVLLAPFYRITYFWYYIIPPEWATRATSLLVRYVTRPEGMINVNDKSSVGQFMFYRVTPLPAVIRLFDLAKIAADEENLEKIDCPVLMIHAHGDDTASPRAARKVFEKMDSEDKRWVWLEKSNHIICWDYDKEIVFENVRKFFAEDQQ
ncbi:MAG: alpha/beta hydrolase [Candidatus Sumerlaeia bacterium]